ncbi:hypothetical protein [Hydrogenophaga sp. BPS33]|uniref:hypothetical protein n=1 Tax=Hydrogenophaga sp. BPS33 TaxID=2651974 RepID=UPI00131F8A21|nr:hypothetical protein [Hydrogenophaga sp. BPS33]QHE84410.1 hypothetical protein F9K07_05665 [Hydrogenophaga sp. BPS33]
MTNTVSSTTPAAATATSTVTRSSGKKPTAEEVRLVLDAQSVKDAIADISKLQGELATEGKRLNQLLGDFQKDPENKTLQKDIRECFMKVAMLLFSDASVVTSNPSTDIGQLRTNVTDILNTLQAWYASKT